LIDYFHCHSGKFIDMLYPQSSLNKEPRTYRQKAYKVYLTMAKQRKSAKQKATIC